MNNYKQLSEKERNIIEQYYNIEQKSLSEIAKLLGRNKSTISRELKRNSVNNKYDSFDANFNTKNRHLLKHHSILEEHQEFALFLAENFKKKFSGIDVTLHKAIRQNIKVPCCKTIYNWINQGVLDLKPSALLRTRQLFWKQKKVGARNAFLKGIPKENTPITFRPKKINERKRIGDFEIDLVMSKDRKGTGIITLVDRKSRYGFVKKIYSKAMNHINEKLEELICENNLKIKSITRDNGKEFNALHLLAKIYDFKIFLCTPYASGERGTNENYNGLIRRELGKKTDFTKIPEIALQLIVECINKMPRKILKWKSSHELFKAQSS